MTQFIEATQTYSYPPLGECMYCGAKEKLSDEHIIPYAMSGTLVLPQSSCERCAAITSRIERKVLRGFMFDARVVGNFPSRRKRDRPTKLTAKLLAADDSVVEKEVGVSEMPAFLTLPTFSPAAVLNGKPPTRGVNLVGTETLHFGKNVEEFVKDHDASGLQFGGTVEASELAQLLAKIAYGYLVATMGLFPREETPLLRLIRGEADDASTWIGSSDYQLQIEAKKPRHAMGIVPISNQEGQQGFVVRVKLFADSGCTGYEIAARVPGWQRYAVQQGAQADGSASGGPVGLSGALGVTAAGPQLLATGGSKHE